MSSTPFTNPNVSHHGPPRLPNKLLLREPIKIHSILHDESRPIIGSPDQPDRLPRKLRVPFYSVVFAILSGILYLAYFGTDIFVGIVQLINGYRLEGILILALACVTSVFVNVVGYLWAIDDLKKLTKILSSYRYKRPVWIIGLITQTIPALFSFQSASNCRRFRAVLAIRGAITAQTVDFYHGVLEADRDSILLFVLTTFIQSGPQLIIQAYVLYKRLLSGGGSHSLYSLYAWAHYASITCSLFGLSWVLMSQQRYLRFVRQDKENLDVTHCILILFWRTLTLAGRLISLLWFALHFHYWLALLLSVHYVIVLTIIGFYEKPKLAQSTTRQWLMLFGVAWVHLFCPWNVAEGPAQWRYVWRYGLECAEFGVVIGLVFSKFDYGREYPVFLAAFCGYVVGLTVMYVYYGCCHPSFTSTSSGAGAANKPDAGSRNRSRYCKDETCGQCLKDCGIDCMSCAIWFSRCDCDDCCFSRASRCIDYGEMCTKGFASCGECCRKCWWCCLGPSIDSPVESVTVGGGGTIESDYCTCDDDGGRGARYVGGGGGATTVVLRS